jgi:hypothetical protein
MIPKKNKVHLVGVLYVVHKVKGNKIIILKIEINPKLKFGF